MKIHHIGDSHGYHELIKVDYSCDTIIHSGDFSNYYDVYKNEPETLNFLHWFGNLKIKHKVLIAGNHDAYAFYNSTKFKEWCNHYNITYLENDYVVIDGVKIWGSPNTPTFGNWYFMKARHKLDKVWQNIPDDTDVIVTHTPPKGILDLSYNRQHELEFCGCSALRKRIVQIKPKLSLFGHIHNNKEIVNSGTMKLSIIDTVFSNGSIVTDGKFGELSSNGNILTIL